MKVIQNFPHLHKLLVELWLASGASASSGALAC